MQKKYGILSNLDFTDANYLFTVNGYVDKLFINISIYLQNETCLM